jgi:hypothetical protein
MSPPISISRSFSAAKGQLLNKGQVAAIECGLLSFEAAFLGQIMLPSGETVLERIERDNVLSLPGPPPKRGGCCGAPAPGPVPSEDKKGDKAQNLVAKTR